MPSCDVCGESRMKAKIKELEYRIKTLEKFVKNIIKSELENKERLKELYGN